MPCSAVIACGQGRMRTSRIRTYNTACPCCADGAVPLSGGAPLRHGRRPQRRAGCTQRWRDGRAIVRRVRQVTIPIRPVVRALTDVLLEWSHSSIDSQ
jgi:hypothetical protein